MKAPQIIRIAFFISLLLAACAANTSTPQPSPAPATPLPTPLPSPAPTSTAIDTPLPSCTPTFDDGLSPSYRPDAPVRAVVGHGHVLTGVVRSSRGCAPIANARLEFWPEIDGQGHPDSARSTLFSDSAGRYRFECDPPEHIHMRISAPGYRTLAQNSYHPTGPTGTFDFVLVPES